MTRPRADASRRSRRMAAPWNATQRAAWVRRAAEARSCAEARRASLGRTRRRHRPALVGRNPTNRIAFRARNVEFLPMNQAARELDDEADRCRATRPTSPEVNDAERSVVSALSAESLIGKDEYPHPVGVYDGAWERAAGKPSRRRRPERKPSWHMNLSMWAA